MNQIFIFVLLFLIVHCEVPKVNQITQIIQEYQDEDQSELVSVALSEIRTILTSNTRKRGDTYNPANKTDVHAHFVPDWYRAIAPTAGGSPTPVWSLETQLSFMETNGISRSILSISTPGADVCFLNKTSYFCRQFSDKQAAKHVARLVNLQAAAIVALYPERFSFYATVPLPYVNEAISEADYALTHLGAVGVVTLSNHQAKYIGNPSFTPFFAHLNSTNKPVVFVHPTTPCLRHNHKYIDANPTVYLDGIVEFYFEDARAFMDLTQSQTLVNFSAINYVVPHAGGSFPSILDRFILTSNPALIGPSMNAIHTRLWWDSAGPTYTHQIYGLLGYNISSTRLLFGTDYPYVPNPTAYASSITAIANAPFLSTQEKEGLFSGNANTLFAGKPGF